MYYYLCIIIYVLVKIIQENKIEKNIFLELSNYFPTYCDSEKRLFKSHLDFRKEQKIMIT